MQTYSYWIVKGNRNNPDRDGDIVTQMNDYIREAEDYRRKRRHNRVEKNIWRQLGKPISYPGFEKGGCVFAWRARRKMGIVGVGRLIDPGVFNLDDREHSFEWEPIDCWSPGSDSNKPDDQYITLEEIRSALTSLPDEIQHKQTFTKPSVIQTVYPVTKEQAKVLKLLIARKVKNLSEEGRQFLGMAATPRRTSLTAIARHT